VDRRLCTPLSGASLTYTITIYVNFAEAVGSGEI